MLVRLAPKKKGIIGIRVLYDTGSSILTLFQADLVRLGIGDIVNYTGFSGRVPVQIASGEVIQYNLILIQIKLVDPETQQESTWMNEKAIVKSIVPGLPRLSGTAVKKMYLATAPGFQKLAVSSNRREILDIIPKRG